MKFGEIFQKVTGKDPKNMTIFEIEKEIIEDSNRTQDLKSYGNNIVIDRGNVFDNKYYDVNKALDDVMKTSLVSQ